MARLLLALCALTALLAASLIGVLVIGQTPTPILKILACVLLIDQSVVTIVFILARRSCRRFASWCSSAPPASRSAVYS